MIVVVVSAHLQCDLWLHQPLSNTLVMLVYSLIQLLVGLGQLQSEEYSKQASNKSTIFFVLIIFLIYTYNYLLTAFIVSLCNYVCSACATCVSAEKEGITYTCFMWDYEFRYRSMFHLNNCLNSRPV